ncbi:MAG: carbohydrate ABC transporter permease [Epulopiscium sp.]|nr:carbohydrate ABC transporter permease [Candidatus Epulonipiscium sp.]
MKLKFVNESREDKVFDVVVTTLFIILMLLVLYPLYFIVIASVSNPDLVSSGEVLFIPKGINFDAYKYILKDQRIWQGYYNTILYTFFGTIFALFLTIPSGYALSRPDLKGKKYIMGYMIFTMYFGGGLIPTYLVIKSLGLIDTPYVLMVLGSFSVFNLIITRTYFEATIPLELQEAAEIDGCSIPRFFLSIVLPLSKSIVAIMLLYYAVGHWNSFFNGMMYVNTQSLYPLQVILRDILISGQNVQADTTDIEYILEMERIARTIKYGVIIVSTLPVLVLYPFVQKHFVKGVMIGSVKG